MANTIVNNENSFLQWVNAGAASISYGCIVRCDDPEQPCLPIFNLEDYEFQVYVEDPAAGWAEALTLGVYIGGTVPSNPVVPGYFHETYSGRVIELSSGDKVVSYIPNAEFVSDLCAAGLDDGQCILFVLYNSGTGTVAAYSNCLKYFADPCFTRRIRYTNGKNAFGFYYEDDPLGTGATYYNKARVFMTMHSPQFPTEKRVFTLSTGITKKLSSVVRKQYQVLVDYQTEQFHQAFTMALEHDTFTVRDDEEEDYTEYVCMDDNQYNIEWQDEPGRYIGIGRATFALQTTPFNNQNSYC